MTAACAARFSPVVEAAMLATYGLDVLDPSVTPRRIVVCMKNLPLGAIQDQSEAACWSTESYLLAGVLDSLNVLTWVTMAANSKSRPKRPKPTERPGVKRNKMRAFDMAKALTGQDGVVVQ